MQAGPEIAQIGRRGLDLAGWGDLSVWGWDSHAGSLFAQLWRDRDDEAEDEDDDRPDIWITPPAWEATSQPVILAGWIAQATGSPLATVLTAMAQSIPGQIGKALMAQIKYSGSSADI
jgi:mRNA-degrading endonuclease toxin of MazEF toxin-antitoxin module